jgi:hypothetical protein
MAKLYSCICFILLVATLSCSKDDGLLSARIEGYDLRLCACCGGLIVKTDDGKTYQWYQKNDSHGITIKSTFPVRVKIEFHHLVNTCVASDGEIEITQLKIL